MKIDTKWEIVKKVMKNIIVMALISMFVINHGNSNAMKIVKNMYYNQRNQENRLKVLEKKKYPRHKFITSFADKEPAEDQQEYKYLIVKGRPIGPGPQQFFSLNFFPKFDRCEISPLYVLDKDDYFDTTKSPMLQSLRRPLIYDKTNFYNVLGRYVTFIEKCIEDTFGFSIVSYENNLIPTEEIKEKNVDINDFTDILYVDQNKHNKNQNLYINKSKVKNPNKKGNKNIIRKNLLDKKCSIKGATGECQKNKNKRNMNKKLTRTKEEENTQKYSITEMMEQYKNNYNEKNMRTSILYDEDLKLFNDTISRIKEEQEGNILDNEETYETPTIMNSIEPKLPGFNKFGVCSWRNNFQKRI